MNDDDEDELGEAPDPEPDAADLADAASFVGDYPAPNPAHPDSASQDAS